MCGIAGFARRSPVSPEVARAARVDATVAVRRMCDAIRHRGPDDEGCYVDEGAAIGMRRLSIIDLATGHQPIANEDRTVWVVFNGEIYNFRELRAELQRAGHEFATATDTEVIVHGYEQWGADVFGRLRGMFGIAVWDTTTRVLWLARDRVGIKPLYYAETPDRLIFGSELKALLASGDIEPALDPAALDHFLTFLYTPRDRAVLRGVRKLPPGHLLRWSDGRAEVRPFWQVPAEATFAGTEDEAVDRLHGVLGDAVRGHMMSDVPLGAFLSGGIDSSLVVGLMAGASARPVRTFSIGFDEPAWDERPYARRVAEHFHTEHHELVVRPEGLDVLDRIVMHFDEPFADVSALPTWYVSELARRHVTVVLTGDGGDELFGGYDRYLPHRRVAQVDRYAGGMAQVMARGVWPVMPRGMTGRNFLRHIAQGPRGRYVDDIAFFHDEEKASLYTPGFARQVGPCGAEQAMAERFARFARLPFSGQMMAVDLETYLPEDVLTKVDRMSMAHSIESRVPLLDNEVIAFATSLPPAWKIRDGVRKHLLKRVAARLLPDEILTRRKQGFGVPLERWFRGSLRDLFGDLLGSARTRQRGYFEPAFIDRVLQEHLSGRRDHALRLWQLVMFELWHRHYLDARPFAPSAADGVTLGAMSA